MKWIIVTIFLLLVQTEVFIVAQRTDDDGDSNDDNDSKCMPKYADSCFTDIYTNLECHLNNKTHTDCKKKDVADLCSAIDNSFNCASDIIDGDCTPEQGSDTFDAWLNGLKGTYPTLCSGSEPLMKVLLQNAECWNILVFVQCVEKKIQISHIADLLLRDLDMQSCFNFLVAIATCNVVATNQAAYNCLQPQDVISEVIYTFFSQSGCGTSRVEFSSSKSSVTRNNNMLTQSLLYSIIILYSILFQKLYLTEM